MEELIRNYRQIISEIDAEHWVKLIVHECGRASDWRDAQYEPVTSEPRLKCSRGSLTVTNMDHTSTVEQVLLRSAAAAQVIYSFARDPVTRLDFEIG